MIGNRSSIINHLAKATGEVWVWNEGDWEMNDM